MNPMGGDSHPIVGSQLRKAPDFLMGSIGTWMRYPTVELYGN